MDDETTKKELFSKSSESLQISIINQISGELGFQKLVNDLAVMNSTLISNLTKDVLPSLERINSAASEIAKSVTQIHFNYEDQLMQIFNSMNLMSKAVTSNFAATRIVTDLLSSFEPFREFYDRVHADNQTAEAFNSISWPISPSIPDELRQRVRNFVSNGRGRYASQSILGYFRKNDHQNLYRMVESWEGNPLFARRRMKIIRDALNQHVKGKYTTSVPALIPQTEGILREYVHQSGLNLQSIREVYETAIGNTDDYLITDWIVARTLLFHLQNNTYAFTDFDTELTRSVGRRRTTRHTILHGIDVNYAREINSLRAFILLDSLNALTRSDN